VRSAAAAFAWEFRRRHLWALIAVAGYLLAVAALKLLVGWPVQPITLDHLDGRATVVTVPLSVTFFYYLAVFSFGLEGDLAARPSIYPSRLFTLPVTTRELTGWPMLLGASAVTSLWLAVALFARWTWGIDLPLIWPALLLAVFLAWTQALTWMPYGWRGLRVVVTVLWLATLDAVVLLAIHFKVREPLMVAFLAPQLPLAYLAARAAVARARRGDVPDWRGTLARRGVAEVVPRRRPFPSPARAQAWFEWRRHGRSLPALVAMVVPFALALLFIPGNDTPAAVALTLFVVLLTPPFMAVFAAAAVSKANPLARDAFGVTPFMATRPMTSAALIAAKLTMALWSALAAWLLVLVAVPVALILSGTWPMVIARMQRFVAAVGTPRALVLVLLAISALLASTWKQMVQSLCIGLTGRAWVIKSSAALSLSFLILIAPIAQWIHDNRGVQHGLWNELPWILAVLVAVKMSAAAWIAIRLQGRRLLSDRTLVTGAACWMVTVLALYGVFGWLVDTPLIPRYLLAIVAILSVPLARLSAAPLSLAWNRHR
jgi:hypothetical protein